MAKDQSKPMSQEQYLQSYAAGVQQTRINQEFEQEIQRNRPPVPQQRPSWMNKPLSRQAQQYFSQPANKCQMCGAEGTLGQTGDPVKDEWEKKWSVHDVCAHAVWDQLDRSSGVASQRRG